MKKHLSWEIKKKLSDWLKIRSGHGILIYSAGQGLPRSIVQNLTKLLANVTLKFLPQNMANTLICFAEKMRVAFALQKLLTFFPAKLSMYLKIS